jgi:hypothetical protein
MAWEVHSSRTSGAPVMPELAEEAAAGVTFQGLGADPPNRPSESDEDDYA